MTTFTITIETVAPPNELHRFEMAVWNLAYSAGAHLIDKRDAVDQAQAIADQTGVVDLVGIDRVQAILAEAFHS